VKPRPYAVAQQGRLPGISPERSSIRSRSLASPESFQFDFQRLPVFAITLMLVGLLPQQSGDLFSPAEI
jgi:hypothetical protein